jgi:DNA-binding CsgD family transcriptional regulator
MDAINRPLLIVTTELRLVHANLIAEEMLKAGMQLSLLQGCVALRSRTARQSVLRHLQDLEAMKGRERRCVRLAGDDSVAACELWIRRLSRPEDAGGQFLLSLIHTAAAEPTLNAAAFGLTPRQRELAIHLLAGHSLAKAASLMGIARSTAKEHLSALFRLSSTTRQPELLAWLTRQQMAA